VTIALAVDDGFAEGKVIFASDAWRYVLGAAGAFLTYRAARALVRAINRATIALTPEHYRGARFFGILMVLIGVGFIIAARSDTLAERSIQLLGSTGHVYFGGGVLLVITGLFQMGRPSAEKAPAS
jgi:hypothetical protein